MNTILFLCTGNYYRSRFAEEYFNHHALQLGLLWRADSRGLRQDITSLNNPGPMSLHTARALQERGIRPLHSTRFPLPVMRQDIENAAITVAVKEAEHRPMLERLFPDLSKQVEYWDVEDLDVWDPALTIGRLEQRINQLINRLAARELVWEPVAVSAQF